MDFPNNRRRAKVTIGIDPDALESGVAIIEGCDVTLARLPFPHLFYKIYNLWLKNEGDIKVVVEGGWLNNGHWHSADNKAVAASIGNKVGRNHETGRKIIEMLEYHKIPYICVKPLKKHWGVKRVKQRDGTYRNERKKISHEQLNKQLYWHKMTQLKTSNEDCRDACLLALTYLT